MKAARPSHAVVSIAALDLRRRPDHASEMRSQLLLGEIVRIVGTSLDGAWRRVRNTSDGYPGWVRRWGLIEVGARRAGRWAARAASRVTAPAVAITAEPGRGGGVGPLFLNSQVIAGARRGAFRRVELPDGRRGWLPRATLARRRAKPPNLFARVRTLLGTPYLWGGRTPAGFDCSGFTQQVLAEQGIPVPRDAWQQRRSCDRLPSGARPRLGDLLFFGAPRSRITHVGLALGGGWMADCRGRVRITSLDHANRLCDIELSGLYRGAGRPRARGPRPAGSGLKRLDSL